MTGRIIDSENKLPISNASISAYKGDVAIYIAVSDSLGFFKLPSIYPKQNSKLIIHALTYDDLPINGVFWLQNIGTNAFGYIESFPLKSKRIMLKEVSVKSTRRFIDTSDIDLSKKKFERSVMIEDLFSKDMGFYKDENGQLYYKGIVVSSLKVNGGDFFGKNNVNIFQLVPALTLSKIEIVTTNIDSTTNTTMSKPTIKVNLKMKDEYKSGQFGNLNIGIGTINRYLANGNFFAYRNNEQISLVLNANNINIDDNSISEPRVYFTINGNNINARYAQFNYRALFKNLELNLSVKGNMNSKTYGSRSTLQNKTINQLSTVSSSSISKMYGIDFAKLTLDYKVDSLSNIALSQSFSFKSNNEVDSLRYNTISDTLSSTSALGRKINNANHAVVGHLLYQKRFASKKGRSISAALDVNHEKLTNSENDNIFTLNNNKIKNYKIHGGRTVQSDTKQFEADYIDPVNYTTYFKLFASFKSEKFDYQTTADSITSPAMVSNDLLRNSYIATGFKLQKRLRNFSFESKLAEIICGRSVLQNSLQNKNVFLNTDVDASVSYNISIKKSLLCTYKNETDYPNIYQLTNISNPFDLISQNLSNIRLRPETKGSLDASYELKISDSATFSLFGIVERYSSKFGFKVKNNQNAIPSFMIDNIGGANEAKIGINLSRSFSNSATFSYRSSFGYQQTPVITNEIKSLNSQFTFNQVVSASFELIKNTLSIAPNVNLDLLQYRYIQSKNNIINLTYTDVLKLNISKFQINLYPFFNYNHNIVNSTSFSMNGGVKRSFFKNYVLVWAQAYDIFNSFRYNNNIIGPTYTQIIRYSNLQRYVLIGLSYKFNNY